MSLAASWTANFTTWHQLSIWIANNNIASLILGILLPGAILAGWLHFKNRQLHRDTRAHNLRLHEETRRLNTRSHEETRRQLAAARAPRRTGR